MLTVCSRALREHVWSISRLGFVEKKFYFKFGTYDQGATKADKATSAVFTQTEVYSASLTHG